MEHTTNNSPDNKSYFKKVSKQEMTSTMHSLSQSFKIFFNICVSHTLDSCKKNDFFHHHRQQCTCSRWMKNKRQLEITVDKCISLLNSTGKTQFSSKPPALLHSPLDRTLLHRAVFVEQHCQSQWTWCLLIYLQLKKTPSKGNHI